ncbi:MAG: AMMECR1 domain-containing protein [Campylobacteraceae bacterium 4484_4]|nr:MAG: AMMECR1 domain-containing protein [Campylobacteraceae bacterium 4484_4]
MTEALKKTIIKIAKEAIKEEFTGKHTIDKESLIKEFPELAKNGAAFVTLTEHNALRGCIGSIIAHQPLIDDIIHNAKAAAFSDPRFAPVSEEEFDELEIEVSLLSEPRPLAYTDTEDLRTKIRPGIDGVILKLDGYQATYLPSVWEQLPDFNTFFMTLCQKAGLPANCLDAHPDIYIYQAEKITG